MNDPPPSSGSSSFQAVRGPRSGQAFLRQIEMDATRTEESAQLRPKAWLAAVFLAQKAHQLFLVPYAPPLPPQKKNTRGSKRQLHLGALRNHHSHGQVLDSSTSKPPPPPPTPPPPRAHGTLRLEAAFEKQQTDLQAGLEGAAPRIPEGSRARGLDATLGWGG